jgi:magnesium transporter
MAARASGYDAERCLRRSTTREVPMPSLPRIRRTRPRGGVDVARAKPRVHELSGPGLTWVHLETIDADVVAGLADRFGWHELDLEDVLSKRQRPKIDEYPEYLFIVLHFPAYDKAIQRLNAAELDLFLGPDFLVTLPNAELLPVSRLFTRCRDDEDLRDDLFGKGAGYLLYHVLDDLFDYCFPILDKIGHKLDRIEDEMFEGRSEEIVRDISNVKQEIISYRKIIKPERATLRLLDRYTARYLPEGLEEYFDDIVDAAERIWDLLDNYKEVVEALEDTNESVIGHRQNDVLRVLAVFSVLLLPLTLIASIFGMNVAFPGEGTSGAFWVVLAVMLATVLALAAFFRYKRWL